MTSSLPPVPLTREDVLKGLDGAWTTSLYDLVTQVPDWTCDLLRVLANDITEAKFSGVGDENIFLFRTFYRPNSCGLPKSQELTLIVPDRTCGGSYMYQMWGTTNVRLSGTKRSERFEVPDFGHPHPFQLTPSRRWDWNTFYQQKSEEKDGDQHLLDREDTGEIWRGLMLLTASIDRQSGEMKLPKFREDASKLLAKMAHPDNTFWGD